MMIREAVNSAGSEKAICDLLSEYVANSQLTAHLVTSRISTAADVWSCFDELVAEMELQNPPGSYRRHAGITEAVAVFDGAINRLSQLDDQAGVHDDASRDLSPVTLLRAA